MDACWKASRKVLVVRLDNLGDVLLATPAIRALRTALADAKISLLASPAGAQIAGLNPDLDDVIVHRAPWMDPERLLSQDPAREASLIASLRRRGFDSAIIFTSYHQSSLPSAYLSYLAGIPLRHAASIDGPGSLLTSRHRHSDKPMHEVERGLELVGGLGVPPAGLDLVLSPRSEDLSTMGEFVAMLRGQNHPVIAIHPGCSCPARTYPSDRFALLADAVQEELDARVVWTGSPDEARLIENIRRGMKRPGHSMAGQTNLSKLAALLARCDIAITSNTGPMHVAAAVKTPVVALFALTNPPHEWRPWAVSHRLLNRPVSCGICYRRVCPFHQECLRDVPIVDAVQAVAELLAERRGSAEVQPTRKSAARDVDAVTSARGANAAQQEEQTAEWR